MKTKLTLSLDDEVVGMAQVLAAQQGSTTSGVVAEVIRQLVEQEERHDRTQASRNDPESDATRGA